MKTLKCLAVAVLLLFIAPAKNFAQNITPRADSIKKAADSKKLIFVPRSADVNSGAAAESGVGKDVTSATMSHVALADTFKVELKPEAVTSFLPYFAVLGNIFNDTGDSQQRVMYDMTGIRSSATTYKYSVKQRKNGEVEVKISPVDAPPIEQYDITISPTGKAELILSIRDHADIIYKGSVTF